jgi:TBC1 domain family protein 5
MSLDELLSSHLVPIVASSRARYADLKATLTADPGKSGADPLSSADDRDEPNGEGNSNTPSWDRYFLDTQLRTTINQDVTRTFQDMPYFHRPATQKMLDEVLFVWSRQNGEIGYRQGMHEVAAIVLWVLHGDRVAEPAPKGEPTWDALESASPSDLEADCHAIFSLVMKLLLLPFYMHKPPAAVGAAGTTGNTGTLAPPSAPVTPSASPPRKPTPLLSTSARIFHSLLQSTDAHLYRTLVSVGVEEQVWGVRWLRLLFSREVQPDTAEEDAEDGRRTGSVLKKVVEMWTAIFAASGLGDGAEETGRQVVEWTAVEMLLAVKDKSKLAGCRTYDGVDSDVPHH